MTPKEIVHDFVDIVRSGKQPERAAEFMAERVKAHQVCSEDETVVERTPDNYTAHVREFIEAFGPFSLQIEEILADSDKVFVRWKQFGQHNVSINGETPTWRPLVEITSAVYRIENGKIVEYWLQFDRKGMDMQIERISSEGTPE